MDEQPPLPGIEPDAWHTTFAYRAGKVHRLWTEESTHTSCGIPAPPTKRGVPCRLGEVPLSRITCKKCASLPMKRSVVVVMHVPRTASAVEIAQAADWIRENGTIPDWLREDVADAIADALSAAVSGRRGAYRVVTTPVDDATDEELDEAINRELRELVRRGG